VLGRQLGEVGVLLGREVIEEGHGHRGGFFGGAEGQVGLLHREAVEVAVDGREGMSGQLDGEARVAQAADDRVVVPQCCGSGGQPRLHPADRPGVPAQRVARGGRPVPHGRRVVGVLLVIAGGGYLAGSFSALLAPGHSVNVAAFTFIGEALFTLWLLAKGRNVTWPRDETSR
jgi:hypothetical protein